MSKSKTKSVVIVTIAYVLAIAVAAVTGYLLADQHLILRFFIADVAATVVIFLFSISYNNSSFYDPYWSLGPIVIAVFLACFFAAEDVNSIRTILILALVSAYGLRLTYNWLRGWTGLDHQDWRYIDLQQKTGGMYWWVSFSGIHLFPTVLVFLGCLPLFPALTSGSAPLNWLDILAAVVTATGILLEGISDNQLRNFRLSKPEKGAILNTGLWKYSRHPNYLGELTFWLGLYLFGLAINPAGWHWMGSGMLSITLLFVLYSVPALDKRSVERRPGYAEHMKKTSAILLWPPKK
ncbi:MAG: DUF1295 domain-containing protein [Bacteroidota bacterium]